MSPYPNEPKFIERVFDRKYPYHLLCFVFFIDTVHNFLCGKDISYFKLSDLDKTISYGSAFIGIVSYFIWMSLMPKLQFWTRHLLWSPLCALYVKKETLPLDTDWVSIDKLKKYAREHKSMILWEEIKERKKRDKEWEGINKVRFSLAILWAIDLWFPGCYLHELFAKAPAVLPILFSIINSFFLLNMVGSSMIPYTYYDHVMYMPEHELAVQQFQKRLKQQEEKRKFDLQVQEAIKNSHLY